MSAAMSNSEPTMQVTIVIIRVRLLFDLWGEAAGVDVVEGVVEGACCVAVCWAFAELII